MNCRYEWTNERMRVYMPKEIDDHIAVQLREEIDLILDQYPVRQMVVDFAATEFMDSSGIGMLIGRSKKLNLTGGEMKAEHLNERIRKIFFVSGLYKLICLEE